jgi:hypothetical protein
MLTARRDPLLHPGAYDPAQAAHPGHAAQSLGFHRFMTFLQVAGSVLAIPLGLASGYSIYHANFSAEARCQGLRANIISMLDKSADASTLRMLVRRDVADFETTCGAVDPDAVAAFKTLLASGKQAAPAKKIAHEPLRPVKEAAKPVPAKPVEAKRARRDTATSDANWVASVREALIHAPAAHADRAVGEELPAAAPAPVLRPTTPANRAPREARAPVLSLAPPASAPAAPVAPQAAPALPPAAAVAATPAPAPGHPVPPASIPEPAPMATASVPPASPAHSGIRGIIAGIPLLGQMIGK